jgi:hypothetical protein
MLDKENHVNYMLTSNFSFIPKKKLAYIAKLIFNAIAQYNHKLKARRFDRGTNTGGGGIVDALFESDSFFDVEPFLNFEKNLFLDFFIAGVTMILFFPFFSSIALLYIDDKCKIWFNS